MNFLNNLLPTNAWISEEQVILNILLAFGLGLVIAAVYRLTSRHKASGATFLLTLIILAMVIALVMMVIGNSIARAFSLVGALSIIRFRTAVKDNRDIAFVFFALAAGMAAGIGNYRIALYGVGTILLLLVLLDFVRFGSGPRNTYLLRLEINLGVGESEVTEILNKLTRSRRQIALKTLQLGQVAEYTYLVRLKGSIDRSTLVAQLNSISGIGRVILLAEEESEEA